MDFQLRQYGHKLEIDHNPGGLWFILYRIKIPDQKVAQEIIDWLAINCFDNFIVKRTVYDIVAGGHGNNQEAWKSKKFNLKNLKSVVNLGVFYEVKLKNKNDNTAFFLRWVDYDTEN